MCACAGMGNVTEESGRISSEPSDEGADESPKLDSPRNASLAAEADAAEAAGESGEAADKSTLRRSAASAAASESGEAADKSTLPARRSLLGTAAPLLGDCSLGAAVRPPTLFRRALHAAGGWSELLGRFRKPDETGETGTALARRPRPPGQPNVAITTAIPPNPCG